MLYCFRKVSGKVSGKRNRVSLLETGEQKKDQEAANQLENPDSRNFLCGQMCKYLPKRQLVQDIGRS